MHKVVDSNYLQRPELRNFLSASSLNMAVLTDYAWMEAYKGNTLNSIYKSMEILADFPDQVILLKNTGTVCGLSGRRSGLQKRLMYKKYTEEFRRFCYCLELAKDGNTDVQRQLLNHGQEATEHIDGSMLVDAKDLPLVIEDIATIYNKNEIAALRNFTPGPEIIDLLKKLIKNVGIMTNRLFSSHPNVCRMPRVKETPNTFIFRAALCAHLLVLDWITLNGAKGAKGVNVEFLRNDMVDVNFAVYATYFDGLLSRDKKCHRIHDHARALLTLVLNGNLNELS